MIEDTDLPIQHVELALHDGYGSEMPQRLRLPAGKRCYGCP
jgi:hypothetical protein